MAKSPKKAKVMALVFDKLDMAACRLARHQENAETVERYRAVLDNDGTLPPIDVHGWPKCPKYFVSDGGHRIGGAKAAKYKSIQAAVTMHPDEATAWKAALAAAAVGNAHHGLPRSDEDLRALVGYVLQMPEMAGQSDRTAADYCACSRATIKKVRIALTDAGVLKGKAAARYTAMPESVNDVVEPEAALTPEPSGRAATNDRVGVQPTLVKHKPIMTGEGKAIPTDEKGMPVPTELHGVFACRAHFRAIAKGLTETLDEVKALADMEAGAALSINVVGDACHTLRAEITAGAPYVVCPVCEGVSGMIRTKCKTCSGRGWLNKPRFEQLSAAMKAACSPKQEAAKGDF